jgi:D-alanyl-D-alanine carboxypeptidase
MVAWIFSAAIASRVAAEEKPVPAAIQAVFDKPMYESAKWGLLVVDLESGDVIYDVASAEKFMTGSVRKVVSVGLALDKLGSDHRFKTRVFRRGTMSNGGTLDGDLVLVASGDLAMGGRMNPDGSLAWTNFDHNEANSLGNAELTAPDPLAGYKSLAKQVASAGVRKVTGDVIIDDRLFVPFDFRGEFQARPIFVNDDVVDVMINTNEFGRPAKVDWRPKSAAFGVKSELNITSGLGFDIRLEPELPTCFGKEACEGTISGALPAGYPPPLTGKYPLVRTFRITQPQNYARTVLIECMREEGVKVSADAVAENAAGKLPSRDAYAPDTQVAELVSPPYDEYATWILKVSYNLGADTSLVLFGLSHGASSMSAALDAEKKTLAQEFGIAASDFAFVDGSGGGESAATPKAIVSFLRSMSLKPFFDTYLNAMPVLAVDGSLAFVTDFAKDKSLAGAKGKVFAKTGTFLLGTDEGAMSLRAQAFGGYITTKSQRRLAYALFVNDVSPVNGLDDVIQVFQDEGTISAIIWRDN